MLEPLLQHYHGSARKAEDNHDVSLFETKGTIFVQPPCPVDDEPSSFSTTRKRKHVTTVYIANICVKLLAINLAKCLIAEGIVLASGGNDDGSSSTGQGGWTKIVPFVSNNETS
jgi:hypothetical protein